MKTLVIEDDAVSRRLLEVLLQRWGHQAICTNDGLQGLELLEKPDPPRLLVLDWILPGLDGLEICRRIRARADGEYFYIIMLTAREDNQDIIDGLQAGADDYVVKPFNHEELRARLRNGERIISLKKQLRAKVDELQRALEHVKQLQGIIPICMHCHRIRDEKKIWHRLEKYLHEHSEAKLSHALCDECLTKHYPEAAEKYDE